MYSPTPAPAGTGWTATERWIDEPAVEDAWGRCLWGLGTAAARSDVSLVRRLAVIQDASAPPRSCSPWPRTMAFAALGSGRTSRRRGRGIDRPAQPVYTDYAAGIARPNSDPAWPWPEPRLTYANAGSSPKR